MEVDREDGRRALVLADDVVVPDLLDDRARRAGRSWRSRLGGRGNRGQRLAQGPASAPPSPILGRCSSSTASSPGWSPGASSAAGWPASPTVRFRLAPLALVALAVQLVLFSPLADAAAGRRRPGDLRRLDGARAASSSWPTSALTGVPLVALGAGLNLAAIVANGGSMPASPAALAALGMGVGGQHEQRRGRRARRSSR